MEKVIPDWLMHTQERETFLSWLRTIRLDPEDKRQLLRTWADRVGVKVSGDIIERAGIERR